MNAISWIESSIEPKERCHLGRIILWFIIFFMITRLFRRPMPHAGQEARRGDPFGRDAREDAQTDRQARERFEFKKRRAVDAGSMGYIWRAARDCRHPQHKKQDGHFVPWDNPPVLEGMPVHAGELPGCTCTAEIVL